MKKVIWWIVGIVAVLAALFLFGGGMMWGNRGYGMTLAPGASAGVGGYGGPGMMGNWGFSPLGWFGMGLGMLFMWLIPIGVLTLIVYGVVALTRNAGNIMPSTPLTSCANCGKGIQADWQNCPHCGTVLK
ncbi:MAG: zinc ribbon domain-containing protein [Anaerolineaceae bacterium]|jgi:uncharacterized membrane protein|nr:MAG: zinc ribbon domain-containing protein [Anaerolineaceae bacterium]